VKKGKKKKRECDSLSAGPVGILKSWHLCWLQHSLERHFGSNHKLNVVQDTE